MIWGNCSAPPAISSQRAASAGSWARRHREQATGNQRGYAGVDKAQHVPVLIEKQGWVAGKNLERLVNVLQHQHLPAILKQPPGKTRLQRLLPDGDRRTIRAS